MLNTSFVYIISYVVSTASLCWKFNTYWLQPNVRHRTSITGPTGCIVSTAVHISGLLIRNTSNAHHKTCSSKALKHCGNLTIDDSNLLKSNAVTLDE
jgi:hypothetical protein